jgi:hypothetical protein
MMQMTQLFFNVQMLLSFALALLSLAHAQLAGGVTAAALAALAATSLNFTVVVPKALAAGRASTQERNDNPDSHSAVDFAVRGGSKTQTKLLHQTVVLVVLANVFAVGVHVGLLATQQQQQQ